MTPGEGRERLHVFPPAHAAAGDDAASHGRTHRFLRGQVWTGEHPVGADIGVNERGHAERIHAPGERKRTGAGRVDPAFDGDLTALGIDAHRNLVAERPHKFGDECFALRRPRADHHPAHPKRERLFHRGPRPHASAQLDLQPKRDDRRNLVEVVRLAGKRTVEIDHMHPRTAGSLELRRHVGGVFGVNRLLVGATLHQPHAAPSLDVDGRINRHAILDFRFSILRSS